MRRQGRASLPAPSPPRSTLAQSVVAQVSAGHQLMHQLLLASAPTTLHKRAHTTSTTPTHQHHPCHRQQRQQRRWHPQQQQQQQQQYNNNPVPPCPPITPPLCPPYPRTTRYPSRLRTIRILSHPQPHPTPSCPDLPDLPNAGHELRAVCGIQRLRGLLLGRSLVDGSVMLLHAVFADFCRERCEQLGLEAGEG